MAQTRGLAAPRPTRRSTARRTRARAGGRTAARRGVIRWDRVARVSLLLVLVAVLASYVGPAANYLEAWQLARKTNGELRDLRRENERLRHRERRLRDPRTIELEARRIGMARPGERVYVIRDLPG